MLSTYRIGQMKIIFALLITTFILTASALSVDAASGYRTKGKNTGYGYSVTNGKYQISIKRTGKKEYLIRKDLRTGKTKILKKLPGKGQSVINNTISAAYGNCIYLNHWIQSAHDETNEIYVYFANKNKLKRVVKSGRIIAHKGKYMISNLGVGAAPMPTVLYKYTKTGLKKVKTLTKYGTTSIFIGKKYIYYAAAKGNTDVKGAIYRVNYKGRHKRKLASVKNCLFVWDISSSGYTYLGSPKKYK